MSSMHDFRDYRIKGYAKILLLVLVMASTIPSGAGVAGDTTQSIAIISWGNNATNDQSLNINVIQGTIVRFNTTTNLNMDYQFGTCGAYGGFLGYSYGNNSAYIDCKFSVVGSVTPNVRDDNTSTGTNDIKLWNVNVLPANPPILTPTPTPTPTSISYNSDVDINGFIRVTSYRQPVSYENKTLSIYQGDTVKWINVADESLTIISEQGLWDNTGAILKYTYRYFSYTFTRSGIYDVYIKEYPNIQHQKIIVNSEGATITPTPTPTITSTSDVTITPTLTPTSTSVTTTATPTPTSTIQIPEIKHRAQLQVTYEVSSLINDRITIKVFLKNVGDATASNINMTIEHSPELEPIAASGSEKIGNTISWTGELLPNAEHISEYSVKAVKGKDVEIPLKVTYAKMSREEKAKALGISSSTVQASISPEDTETILMIIKILKALPGFELILAISILFLVHVFLKK